MEALFATAAGVLFVSFGVFAFPLPKPSFRVTYSRVSPAVVAALQRFRKRNPLKRLDVNGVAWHYHDAGAGTEAVLFLHGMGGAGDIWFQQVESLAGRVRCIAPTYPPIRTLEQLRSGIAAILARERVERVHVVGSSMGGYLAQFLMAREPGRVGRVVLGNTFAPNTAIPRRAATGVRYLPWVPEWALMLGLRRNAAHVLYSTSGGSELVKAYLYEQTCGLMRKWDFIGRCACLTETFTAPSSTHAVPVLIVESDNDPLIEGAVREALKRAYPSAVVKTFHGAGHFPYLCRPEEYTRLLFEFLLG